MRNILFWLAGFLIFVSTANAQQWSTFQNGGKLENATWQIAKHWSPDEGIAWQKSLAGYGQSNPIVFDDNIYITSVTGPKKETINVEAFNIADGQRRWIHSQPNSTLQDNTVMISRAAASPAADEGGVVAMFEGGNVVALDHDGKVRWQKDLVADYGDVKARHGLSGSLEQNKEHLFVWVERTEKPYVLALRKSDGSEIWKVDGVGGTSWGSPRLLAVGGTEHLVLSASGKIVGLNPANGKRLWSFDDIQGNTSATPIPIGDGRFMIGSNGNRDGEVTKPCCGVIQIESIDSAFFADWVWSSKKLTCSFGSPIAHQGKAYFVNRSGILQCRDLETGARIFKSRLPSGSIWATPLATEGLVYFFGKNGVTTIVEPGSELKIVAKNCLWSEETKPSPASKDPESGSTGSELYAATAVGNRLLLRRGDRLYACQAK